MTGPGGGLHRLVLLRHAKAEPGGATDDVLRPLALVGRKHAGNVGTALVADGLVPDLVLCSPAVRTRQTWELASSRLGDVDPEVRTVDALYPAGVAELMQVVHGLDARARTVLVVGHEPTMAATAEHLAGTGSDTSAVAQVRVGVPTATYSVLESDASWQAWEPRGARLVRVHRPPR
ncbi:histidine phosphatase family protein [Cellulomonas sp. PhB143]|uniref:SixA phosphatase family protein n=1 Tax=Cellulomonas sp. PhB143 TaxID=2485186 RepID=UPI000FA018DE|nr:histidine phosphatase family protein [Cellulomonas sp. PhB143]ROS74329.1 phosphohistidine phosphatase [Cellulomonas sp. PhB143]